MLRGLWSKISPRERVAQVFNLCNLSRLPVGANIMENQKEILFYLCQDFISDVSHLLEDYDYFYEEPNRIIEIIMFSIFVISQGYITANINLPIDKVNQILEDFNDEVFDFIINK
jgi:hypothetical protein